MKQIIGACALVALCAGCASETGIHYISLDADRSKCDPVTKDLIPSFRINEKHEEISDQGRASVLGKWRIVINTDRASTGLGGGICVCGQWEIDVYEFNDDGTYSMRRVAEDKTTVLKDSGEDGQWTYSENILRMKCKRVVSPGAFPFAGPQYHECGDLDQGEEYRALYEFRVKWHSNSAFTLVYADLDKVRASYEARDKRVKEAMGVKNYSTSNIHYDENGCLHEQSYCNDGRFDTLSFSVTNSKLFKRVGK